MRRMPDDEKDQALLSIGNCDPSPHKLCEPDGRIVASSQDAASIFGASKARGGPMRHCNPLVGFEIYL